MIAPILLVLSGETFTAIGQLFLKRNTNRLGSPALDGPGAYVQFAVRVLRLPGIWLGLLFMAFGLIIWLIALSWFNLSLVFPIGSVQYVLVLFASRIFLKEKLNAMKVCGTLLIIAGIIAVSFSS